MTEPTTDPGAGARDDIVMRISRSHVPALSDAMCRGLAQIEDDIDAPEFEDEREDLRADRDAIIALRDDLQRQANDALAARNGGAS